MLGTDSTTFAINRYLGACAEPVLSLRRVRISRAGYEIGAPHRYWGTGLPLYRASTPDGEITLHERAAHRWQARAAILARMPGARIR